ncbi:hypothetical protein [Cereibacter sphaeroides]|uniref:hypothetical protein n=1 Tax=Cereibacter sphaeroides TaxID=1063 RepID=UPI0015613CB7|nr:hypothetical protein [Cereibacter sphaeroides]
MKQSRRLGLDRRAGAGGLLLLLLPLKQGENLENYLGIAEQDAADLIGELRARLGLLCPLPAAASNGITTLPRP